MIKNFKIGGFCFQLKYPKQIQPPKNFMLFETKETNIEYSYEIIVSDLFPHIDGKIIARRDDLVVYKTIQGECRLIGIKGIEGYYACYEEENEKEAIIYIHPKRIQGLNIDPVFTSLLALEKRLISKNEIILHCAYIRYNNEAILFSAPSETGKTTQANLWHKYLNSENINGDRSLLTYHNQWIAQGWPVCGTSEICHNISTPIKAIVMLSQGQNNVVEKLSPAKAFSLLYSQITINKWNTQDHVKAMDIIEQLINNIPVYHLSCTISKEAVLCLQKELYF